MSLNCIAQSLFVPQGTNGIGTSSSSNVGLGTSNPMELFHINGNIRGGDATNGALKINTPSGYLIMGPQSLNSCELITDKLSFSFNKSIISDQLTGLTGLTLEANSSVMDFKLGNTSFMKADNDYLRVNNAIWAYNDIRTSGLFWMNSENPDVNFRISPADEFQHVYIDYKKNLYFRSNSIDLSCSSLLLESTGNVGVGFNTSYNPNVGAVTQGYKFAVNGGILCEEVKVIADVPGADYVFDNDYKLMNLKELEKYIHQNNHLPEIPSANEFKTNGYKVGEMDNLLLQKIEELTLYLIEQNKIIQEQEKKIQTLEEKIVTR